MIPRDRAVHYVVGAFRDVALSAARRGANLPPGRIDAALHEPFFRRTRKCGNLLDYSRKSLQLSEL